MKKSLLSLLVLILTLALPGLARAAVPEIKLELDEDLQIVATLSDPDYDATNGFRACFIKSQIDSIWLYPTPTVKPFEIGRVRVGNNQPTSTAERIIANLLARDVSVECSRDKVVSLTPVTVTWIPVAVTPLRLSLKKGVTSIQSSVAALSPGIDWLVFGDRFRDALIGALGMPTTCNVVPRSEVAKCVVGPIDDINSGLRLIVTGATDVQGLEVQFSKLISGSSGKTVPVPVKLNVAQCAYHAAGTLPYILAGASRQTLFLASERPECQARLDRLTSLDANGLKKPISAQSQPSSLFDVGNGKRTEIFSVPAELPTGELTFTLKANGEAIGTATLLVLEAISAGDSPKVSVSYHLPNVEDLPDGFVGRTNDGIAVVTPTGVHENGKGEGKDKDKIFNTVSIPIKSLPLPSRPEDIRRLSNDMKPWSGDVLNPASSKDTPEERSERALRGEPVEIAPTPFIVHKDASKWAWRIRPAKGAPEFRDCAEPPTCELKHGPGTIEFTLNDPSSGPIEAIFELVEFVQVTTYRPGARVDDNFYDKLSLFETTVRLAASARVESLPLPIRDRLYVDCRGANRNVTNSEMRAVDDEDVVNGTCALVLLPVSIGKPGPARDLSLFEVSQSALDAHTLIVCQEYAARIEKCAVKNTAPLICENAQKEYAKCSTLIDSEIWRTKIDNWMNQQPFSAEARRLNPFYGSQRLIVVVKRDGKEIATKRWIVDPDQPTLLELPHGTDTERGNLYSVEVRVAARPDADVFYASAKVDNGKSDDSDIPQTEIRFSAQLRSRGQFGVNTGCLERTWFRGFRAYATIPVQLAGFRGPSATSELRASSDSVLIQYMTPRTGLLGVVEPWSYDTGQNPAPLNPGLAGGFLAFELANPRVNFSTLLGIQVQAPFLKPDSSQLSSSIALGLFWEHSVEEKENRVLLTLGANVLSLFAGK